MLHFVLIPESVIRPFVCTKSNERKWYNTPYYSIVLTPMLETAQPQGKENCNSNSFSTMKSQPSNRLSIREKLLYCMKKIRNLTLYKAVYGCNLKHKQWITECDFHIKHKALLLHLKLACAWLEVCHSLQNLLSGMAPAVKQMTGIWFCTNGASSSKEKNMQMKVPF